MIVDINERQSGKTTRLLEHAFKNLRIGNEIVLVGHKLEWANDMKKKLLKKYPSIYNLRNNIIVSSKMIREKINYVDEFAFNRYELFIDTNSYYCSTIEPFDMIKQNFKFIEDLREAWNNELKIINTPLDFFYN